MTESFRWGLIGPGAIANRFAEAVAGLPDCRLEAVLGRDAQRAQAFAARWQIPTVARQVDELLALPLDAIYIATPHAQHAEFLMACLRARRPVLCEKPLVANLAQGQAVLDLAAQQGVFLMEALWTRFLPVYQQLAPRLRGGAVGELRSIRSSFCFPSRFDPNSRLYDPAQAGGALLDIGIYCLAMTRWVMAEAQGGCPAVREFQAEAVFAPSGVDQRLTATIAFENGLAAQLVCAVDGMAENSLHIEGSSGRIVLPEFWQAQEALLYQESAEPQRLLAPWAINGFEGEVAECMRCIRAGLLESPLMPHSESLALLAWMDQLRRQIGLHYPFE
ncbi:Gfo/Idh/MocA family oxidoreductase [Paucibacter sp. APW11]|uniref:Gfo/Idh/MocA family oxidoreductase n=1 Tax=Roseateles aquae TaxID=3077235 RepID=A0ABU3P906_9BURK|nr:Gfo/Idh/MocA family oxidoreductase [Paucibacter sp. APW11]MDT8999029.1 Gfo/Idh/MocA family oxidoreductase [Paucibacter sp. APW11]